jgi:hypothetical protein
VAFGAFQLVDVQGSSRFNGKFLGPAVVTEGQGGGIPGPLEVRVIKLIK